MLPVCHSLLSALSCLSWCVVTHCEVLCITVLCMSLAVVPFALVYCQAWCVVITVWCCPLCMSGHWCDFWVGPTEGDGDVLFCHCGFDV